MGRALCISVEGIDGAGKSTFIKALAANLQAAGIDLVQTRDPGGTPVGDAIRGILKSPLALDSWTQALLFVASRRALVTEVINPALDQDKWVLIDRFVDSMYVYQSTGQVPIAHLRELHKMTTKSYLPDCTFWLDLPVELAYARVHQRGVHDAFDNASLDYYRSLAQGFQDRYQADNGNRIYRLDASLSLEQMVQSALQKCFTLSPPAGELESVVTLT